LSQLVIPAANVKAMAFEIDVCGFRKGDIFPDLQNLASELSGIYRPSRPAGAVSARKSRG
jgi:hypothetical protein